MRPLRYHSIGCRAEAVEIRQKVTICHAALISSHAVNALLVKTSLVALPLVVRVKNTALFILVGYSVLIYFFLVKRIGDIFPDRLRIIRFPCAAKVLVAKQMLKSRKDRKSTRLNSSHVRISYAVF